MRSACAVPIVCGVLSAIGCSAKQSRGTQPLDTQVVGELEALSTGGLGLRRIIEVSWTLSKGWPSSEPTIRALLSSRIPSLNLAGLNAIACVKGEVDAETRQAAARLIGSRDPHVRFMATWWQPEENRLQEYEALGRQMLGSPGRNIRYPDVVQLWLAHMTDLPTSDGLERIVCEFLIRGDWETQRSAAEYLRRHSSTLGIEYTVRLMQENQGDYFQRQREAAALLNDLAGIEIPFEATSVSKSPWLAEILDALAAWDAGRDGVPPSPFRLPPKPVVDESRFMHGDPRQDDIK